MFLVNCQWGEWNEDSECSKSCGGGTQTRSRSKIVVEKYGGKCDGASNQTISCNKEDCPSELVNRIWFFSVTNV